jgi:hypothetical protein
MNELRVEKYDAKEVAAKKSSIIKRVAGSAIVVTLSLFSLTGCPDPDPPIVAGGAGAWFHSYPDDEYTEDEYTEYTDGEYTDGEES